jgi:hypothetical protein
MVFLVNFVVLERAEPSTFHPRLQSDPMSQDACSPTTSFHPLVVLGHDGPITWSIKIARLVDYKYRLVASA